MKPIVNHQIMKKGFNALRKIPAKNELLPLFVFFSKLFLKIDFICNPANTNNPIAPIIVNEILNSGKFSNDIVPTPSKIINGSSTIV